MSISEGNSFPHLTVNTASYKLPVMNKTLAERLAYAMNERGISQGALAKASGVAQPTIWRLVKGEAKGSTRLVDIARALSISVEWLANGTGSMVSDEKMTYPHPPKNDMSLGGVFPVPIFDKANVQTEDYIYVPQSVESDTCRAYMLDRNSGCSEAPAGTVVVVDTAEHPGNGDLVYALVNDFYSVYRFVDGGPHGYLSVDDDRVPLVPAVKESTMIGVVVFLLRDLKRKK
ncbi:helix-turn-helix domain-containing protein [Pantoea sp. S18]|uniref:helix-turn-helix domain-containing protein n=1 Tax=Pantoea sp. S18 TaxID=3019892 RepID=UPI002B1F3301|nr:helix-turn-helix domain-containing protein [Pantoea sp. S18]MEA5104721.1 helix-turn-helix domain-containing protein [Pantoea sp. S18]